MKRIRILKVCDALEIGGTEKAIQIFSKYLDKSKFEVIVCGRKRGGCRADLLKSLGIPVIIGPIDINKIVREYQIDICHTYRSGHYDPGLLPTKLGGWPKILETNIFHDFDPIEGGLIDCHLFLSNFSKGRYLEINTPHTNADHQVLYFPVDFTEIPATQKNYSYTIGRCSRADDQKWHKACVDCLPKVFRHVPEANCLFQGATDKVFKRIQRLGLSERVRLSNPNVNVGEFYKCIDIFIHGARVGETFGLVIAEAMANKIPIITLSTPQRKKSNAQAELVEHNVTGLVCRWSWQYGNAVIELLKNHELRERFTRRGYEKARDQFEASSLTRKLEQIYIALMDGS